MNSYLDKINEVTSRIGIEFISLKEYCENVLEYKKQMDFKIKNLFYNEKYGSEVTNVELTKVVKNNGAMDIVLFIEKGDIYKPVIINKYDDFNINSNIEFDNSRTLREIIKVCEENYNYLNYEQFNSITSNGQSFELFHEKSRNFNIDNMQFRYTDDECCLRINVSKDKDELLYRVYLENDLIKLNEIQSREYADNIYIDNDLLPNFMKDYLEIKNKKQKRKRKQKENIC